MYLFKGMAIDGVMFEALERYVKHGIKPGDFLQAVISNDLMGAVGKADDANIHKLSAYVAYFYNEAPTHCWGTYDIMLRYIAEKKEERELEAQKELEEMK